MIGNAHRGKASAAAGHGMPLSVILTLSLLGAFSAGPLHAGGNTQIECAPAPDSLNCDPDEIVDAAWSDLAIPVRWWMNDAGAQNNLNQGGV
ncbi:MAG: hypothetical protein V3U86_13155, partial [Acidobacteriota bacterium]